MDREFGSGIASHRDCNASGVRCAAVLKEKNALPGSQRESAIHHGDHFRSACQCHAQMARHVVCAFVGVNEIRCVFRHEVVEETVQICACGRISILKDHQARAGVLHEDRRGAGADAAGFHDLLAALRDLVSAFASCGDGELIGVGSHVRLSEISF